MPAQNLIGKVFEVSDRKWRGIGNIPMSGYRLRSEFAAHDAEQLFDVAEIATLEPEICISGEILRGIKKPHDCPAFGDAVQSAASAGRDNGIRGGRLCCLLRVRAAPETAGRRCAAPDCQCAGRGVAMEDERRLWRPLKTRRTRSRLRRRLLFPRCSGRVRSRFTSTSRSCWAMAVAAS